MSTQRARFSDLVGPMETLIEACREGDAASVRRILRRGGSQLDIVTSSSTTSSDVSVSATPLMMSIIQDHEECVRLLLAAHANPSVACGKHEETALHVCCARGKIDYARLLIDAGADIGASDVLGRSPLLMSCLCDHPECTELMIKARAEIEQSMVKHNPGATPLYAAALAGSLRSVALLCDAGANVDAKNHDGATPMMVSSQQGHLKTCMLLSSYGASRERTVFKGCVPTTGTWAEDLAIRSGNEELVCWLRESKSFGPLHHIEVLTPQRTLALLRSGRFSPLEGGSSCPAARAHTYPANESASLILQASEPWSPAAHELWGRQHRAFAVELLRIGYRLRAKYGDALFDAWVTHVMPHSVSWEVEEW